MSLNIAGVDPAKQAFSLFEEFKNFAFKGNVLDMAVGVIIGGGFQKIIDALVKTVIMPCVAMVVGGDPTKSAKGMEKLSVIVNGVELPYGQFIAELINFLLLAAVLFFFIVKFLGWIMRTKKVDPPAPPADVALLTEIRDLLKAQARPTASPA